MEFGLLCNQAFANRYVLFRKLSKPVCVEDIFILHEVLIRARATILTVERDQMREEAAIAARVPLPTSTANPPQPNKAQNRSPLASIPKASLTPMVANQLPPFRLQRSKAVSESHPVAPASVPIMLAKSALDRSLTATEAPELDRKPLTPFPNTGFGINPMMEVQVKETQTTAIPQKKPKDTQNTVKHENEPKPATESMDEDLYRKEVLERRYSMMQSIILGHVGKLSRTIVELPEAEQEKMKALIIVHLRSDKPLTPIERFLLPQLYKIESKLSTLDPKTRKTLKNLVIITLDDLEWSVLL